MKFNRILEQYVKENESLTKVRLKVDPKDSIGIDFRNFDGYEGYIIKEGKYFSILFEGVDLPIMQVPFSVIKVIKIGDTDILEKVKVAAIEKINRIKEITPEFLNKISACTSVDFLEQYLKEEGLSESDIKSIYKNNMFSEDIDVGKLAGYALFPDTLLKKFSDMTGPGKSASTPDADADASKKSGNSVDFPQIKLKFNRTSRIALKFKPGNTNDLLLQLGKISKLPEDMYYNSATGDIFKIHEVMGKINKLEICNMYINKDLKSMVNEPKLQAYFNSNIDDNFIKYSIFKLFKN
jgi:hypothetical protein